MIVGTARRADDAECSAGGSAGDLAIVTHQHAGGPALVRRLAQVLKGETAVLDEGLAVVLFVRAPTSAERSPCWTSSIR